MRMPFRHEEPASRLDRVRSEFRDRSADAASTVSSAAGAAQVRAQQAADRATVVAYQVADRASVAATVAAERARPVAAEAASRGGAAWQVLLHGTPQPSPMARVVSVMSPAGVTTAVRRSRVPMGLMAVGAAGAVAVLMWRRSRAGADSVWILDSDADVEPVGRWSESERRGSADHSADDSLDADRRDSPANRWP